jgi:hypothetical protein
LLPTITAIRGKDVPMGMVEYLGYNS